MASQELLFCERSIALGTLQGSDGANEGSCAVCITIPALLGFIECTGAFIEVILRSKVRQMGSAEELVVRRQEIEICHEVFEQVLPFEFYLAAD